ncbi:hypothetical protein [Saccharibacillus brassicae]|uniref:Fibronectin type III domain-containing protein n=1 Tax=Saccharibacillus brassicae TaxID=2583377 RepID=A0A4Y6UWB9_SACBS|nr:hypothetical protein [Saccharibacillus brassicae]QDH21404.1 hypothetical protein FFV09_11480 [Saccharibacillus brassicae]
MKKLLIMFCALFLLLTNVAIAEPGENSNADLIPKMTASDAPSGKVTSSSDTWSAAQNYYAFDDINKDEANSPWIANSLPAWLAYEFQAPTVVNTYSITGQMFSNMTSSDNIMRRHPKDWTFEGYDESTGKWVTLDTQSNVTSWTIGQKKEFAFSNLKAYKNYRIYITAIIGPNTTTGVYWTGIGELEMMNKKAANENNAILLTATPGNKVVTLNWTNVGISKSYVVKRSTKPGGPYTTLVSDAAAVSYTDNDVVNGTEYYYVVTATDTDSTSNEVSAIPFGTDSNGGRALLTVYILGGQIKEYDLSISEVNAFIEWYDTKDSGVGPAKYKFVKTWNPGPFKSRSEYVIFDKILTFDVDEYDVK